MVPPEDVPKPRGLGAEGLECWERKCLGAFWGFPSESRELGIFSPPPPPSVFLQQCLSLARMLLVGSRAGFKKSSGPHNALPFPGRVLVTR